MPIKVCNVGGKPGFKWGDAGKCYTYESSSNASRGRAKQKAYLQGRAIGESAVSKNGTLSEAGKSISSANAEKIKLTIAALNSLLGVEESNEENGAGIEAQNGEGTAAKEAASAPVTPETIEEIIAGLQKLINYIPQPAREQLEGDGDFDNDAMNVLLQRAVGDSLLPESAVPAA